MSTHHPTTQPALPPYGGPQPGLPVPPQPGPRKGFFARHKILTSLLVVGVFVLGVAVAGGGGSDASQQNASQQNASGTKASTSTQKASGTQKKTEKAGKKAAKKAPGIGDEVRDGKFAFTVTKVEKGVKSVGDEYLGEKAQGQFVLVHVKVENIGDEAQTFFGSNQTLTDSAGRTFDSDDEAAIYLDDSNALMEDVNPGNTVKGVVVFDVPKGAQLASLELHDSAFSGGVTVSLAG